MTERLEGDGGRTQELEGRKVELRQAGNGRIKLKRPGGCNEKCR